MAGAQYGKAYEAYQQAVYRDGRNPAFWCSIGVLYYKINQYHDSLDAYSRAIRTNPYLAEVWHNLGALYESCNDQLIDAVDAYRRAISLDENNEAVRRRLEQIDFHRHARGQPLSPPPKPIDISPLSESWNAANGSASFTGPQSASTPGGTSQPFNPAFPNGLPESSQPTAVSMPVNNLTTSNGGRRSIGDATAPPSRPGPEHFPAPTNGAASSRAPPARDYAASYSLAGGNARPLSRSEMPSRSAAGWNGPPPASIAPASSLPPNRSGRMGHSPPISPHQGRNDYTMNPPHRPVPDEGERGRPAMGYRDQHSMSNYAGPTLVDRRPNTSPVPNGNAIPPAVAERERQLQQQQQQAGVRRRSSFQSRGMSPPTHNGPPTATGAAPALAAIRGPIKEKRPASTQPPGKPRNVIIPPVPRSDASNRPSPAPTSSHSADTQMRPRDAEESYDQEEGADSLIALASGASGGSSNRSNGAGPRQGSEPLPRPIPVAPVPRKRSAGELGHPPARVSSTSPVDDQAGTNSKRPKLGNGPVWANSGGGSTTSVGPSPSTPQAPVSQIDGLSRSSPAVQTAVVEAPLSRGPSPTNSLPAQPTSGTEAKAGEEVASQE